MKHLGDITKIDGSKIEPVDTITFGSPCQDLSVAGKQTGLSGERSGLFIEAVRIIKEMRGETNGLYPTFAVWENVPGAFSSNKGEDFRVVLEELTHIIEPTASIPEPPTGKWRNSGCILGDGWSIAWRVFDAQFWGVPQRRRRIALVLHIGGHAAPEILFVRDGLYRNNTESGETRQGVASCPQGGVNTKSGVKCLNPWDTQSARVYAADGIWHSLYSGESSGQSRDAVLLPASSTSGYAESSFIPTVAKCLVVQSVSENQRGELRTSDTCPALSTGGGKPGQGYPCICIPINDKATRFKGGGDARNNDGSGNGLGIGKPDDPSPTLTAGDRHAVFDARGNGDGAIVPTITGDHNRTVGDFTAIVTGVDCRNGCENNNLCPTLQAKAGGGFSYNCIHPVRIGTEVRRLTPLECERLQGYPDHWTDIGEWIDSKGKLHKESSDAARYTALGNSIALPSWKWVLKRISAYFEYDATLGSLFDGIGGFPYIWEQINGTYSARWASEIEEFPIAVTKYHFGG